MKTMVMNYVNTMDQMIPDADMAVVLSKCNDIHEDVKNTGMCALASMVCAGKTMVDTTELGLIISKTVVKKTVKRTKKVISACKVDEPIVRR